jgi:hypothetical protein
MSETTPGYLTLFLRGRCQSWIEEGSQKEKDSQRERLASGDYLFLKKEQAFYFSVMEGEAGHSLELTANG